MPTYRYECASCDAKPEFFQSINEKPKRKCPECGGKLTRLIGGGGGVILKGSGFYTTDYRSDSYHSAAKADRAEPARSGETSSGGADSGKSTAGDKAAGKSGDAKAAKKPTGSAAKSKKKSDSK
ncbi:MAG: zinc ribbon domain-containing protein [Gemmatimonadetes bacterium]|nr:zinc ribbon domain-containing protein [Gemmatimonadota bacterium]